MALRDPVLVIDSILAVDGLPAEMRRRLGSIRGDQAYKAPEQHIEAFWQIQDVMSRHVLVPLEETWEVRAVAVWMNITEAEVLEQSGGPLAKTKDAG